jgi:hypothetical protein
MDSGLKIWTKEHRTEIAGKTRQRRREGEQTNIGNTRTKCGGWMTTARRVFTKIGMIEIEEQDRGKEGNRGPKRSLDRRV